MQMQMEINFYDEKITIPVPKTFADLKKEICSKYLMEPEDANEFEYSITENNKKKLISNESDYKALKSSKNMIKLNVNVLESSKLFQKETQLLEKEQINTNKSQAEPSISQIIHQNYACDGCNQEPIVGIRYKCCVCPNYDLCEKCEKKMGNQHGHPFLKIRKPECNPIDIQCYIEHK